MVPSDYNQVIAIGQKEEASVSYSYYNRRICYYSARIVDMGTGSSK